MAEEQETTPEEFRQRALLLADLGRYDEAADELAEGISAAPADAPLLTTLARIHLAAAQPAEALVAADRAVAAAPDDLGALVTRAMALTDNQRYGEAADVASRILRDWSGDAYGERTGAALLSESRNGQAALNAAWNGVRLADSEPEAHLVLAVVAARMRMFELAQRAYGEALELDPALGDATADTGIVRFERRRWSRALEDLADGAVLPVQLDTEPYPSPFPRPYQAPDRPIPDLPPARTSASWAADQSVSKPTGPVLDSSDHSAGEMRRVLLFAANATLIAALTTALMLQVSGGASRVWGGLIGLLILVGVPFWLKRHLREPIPVALARQPHRTVPAYAILVAPIALIAYTLVGGLIPLLIAMALAGLSQLFTLLKP